ncbi:hypothetical protein GQ44DRAFT_777468 [Phaeosphaeriaceae sp. PMI808]|nr:hypothetical protein GQ44DRAFT_777468 [Phaeosphaeriaceae sp. PMI808]
MSLRILLLGLLTLVSAEVELLSINLKGWEECNRDQIAKISAAWENAVKMADALEGNINFNEGAAIEYLGPPAYTEAYEDTIRQVFKHTAGFGQGSVWVPSPFKWVAYVRCDDWRKRCGKLGVKAYTENHMGDPNSKEPGRGNHHEHDTSTPVINFCPGFFRMNTFAEKVQQNENAEIAQKYNVD